MLLKPDKRSYPVTYNGDKYKVKITNYSNEKTRQQLGYNVVIGWINRYIIHSIKYYGDFPSKKQMREDIIKDYVENWAGKSSRKER